MTVQDGLAALGLLLLAEGLLPFVAPAMWRDGFRRMLELRDGQLRFIGAASGGSTRISRLRCLGKAMDARRVAQARVVPLPSGATPQTRFPEATRRDGGDSGAFLCRGLLAVNDTAAQPASRTASRIAAVAGVKCVLIRPDAGGRFFIADAELI